jgi:hypothetical protein
VRIDFGMGKLNGLESMASIMGTVKNSMLWWIGDAYERPARI